MCDACIYVKSDNSFIIVLHVDDLLVIGPSEVGISKTKAFLMTKFALKGLGDVSLLSGMQVSRDRLKGTLGINRGKYVQHTPAAIRFCRQQIGKHTRHWKTPGPVSRNSTGRCQQTAIPRICVKSPLLIDVYALGHCLLCNAVNSGDE